MFGLGDCVVCVSKAHHWLQVFHLRRESRLYIRLLLLTILLLFYIVSAFPFELYLEQTIIGLEEVYFGEEVRYKLSPEDKKAKKNKTKQTRRTID